MTAIVADIPQQFIQMRLIMAAIKTRTSSIKTTRTEAGASSTARNSRLIGVSCFPLAVPPLQT